MISLGSLSLLLAGCATAPTGIPPESDPSNPQAAEAPLPPRTNVLAEPETVAPHPNAPPPVSEQAAAATAQGAQPSQRIHRNHLGMGQTGSGSMPGMQMGGMQMQPHDNDGGAP